MGKIAEQSQRLKTDFIARPHTSTSALMTMTQKMLTDPATAAATKIALWQSHMGLWQSTTARMLGGEEAPLFKPTADDYRFKEKLVFDHIKKSHLMIARWMRETAGDVEGLDKKTAAKVDFHTRQFADALAPAIFCSPIRRLCASR